MKEQRCLYCERPLALLSRLTGDGEFCSKEHRRIYQKEHSQLALARLLQAQPSTAPGGPGVRRTLEKPAPEAALAVEPAVPQAPVAVAEPVARKSRSRDPEMARFAEMPELDPRVWAVSPPQASPPIWTELPRRLAYRQDGFPRFVKFVAPGAFLRRPSQPAAPALYAGSLLRGGIAPAIVNGGRPQTNLFEERLRRTERIGFCPP